MESLDEARAARTTQLDKANGFLERLAYFIGSHADAVDGDDRVQLRELSQSMMKRHADIAAIIASGPTAVMQLSCAELIATLEETAIAGMATLQIRVSNRFSGSWERADQVQAGLRRLPGRRRGAARGVGGGTPRPRLHYQAPGTDWALPKSNRKTILSWAREGV